MNLLPQFRQLITKDALQQFGSIYLKSSGLPVPDSYLYNSNNKVYGIFWKKELIGGFILGRGPEFRTISLFAKTENQAKLYESMGERENYTEICCFWIKRAFRTKTALNLFVWMTMTYALKVHSTKRIIFGTCSRSLARLYGQTSKTVLINEDRVNGKPTFIFWANRRDTFSGMKEIISYKLSRAFKVAQYKSIPAST